jgi:CRP-like cAMP-binding protein
MYELLHTYFAERTDIDDATFATICKHCKPVKARRNEILLMQGEICRYYYFVNKGCIRLFTINNDGQEATRYFAFEGAFGSALPSLIQQQPAFEFVQAIEQSELLAFPRDDFFVMVNTIPQVGTIYRQILEAAFITAQERIYGFQGLTALEKLRWLLAYQPNIFTRLSNKMVASFLGVTPFTLSRLKAEL